MDRISAAWNDLAGRFQTMWATQSRQSRMLAVVAIAAFVLVFGGLGALYFGHQQPYEVLFSNLAASDASAVTQHLKDDKVPYTLSSDGKTVYVPAADLSNERVAIAGANVIKNGSTGYELFDKTNFGMTEFEQNLDKTRATEGELERTIAGLEPVQAVRVHIAQPAQTLYSSTADPTTASIALTTKDGETLSPQQVEGITMLVARAVEGLKPENVTLIDQNGQVLVPSSNAAQDGSSPDALSLTQSQLAAKQRYETDVQQSIQSMLDQTLGPRHAVARVSTKMDFDATSTEAKTYAPAGTVLSSQTKRETYNGNQPANRAAIGVPGTTSNIGTYQGLQSNQSSGKYNKTESTTNYNISVQDVKHITAPGKVLQTSVAVVVNTGSAQAAGQPVQPGSQYQVSAGNINQIRNLVIAAAGLNVSNGDQVSVEAIPFNPATMPAFGRTQGSTNVLGLPLWVLLALGGVGLLILLGLLATRSRRASVFGPRDLPAFDPSMAELPAFEDHPMLESPGIAAPIRSAADLTREQMVEYVTTVAQESPESVAKLVKLWLAE
ncbi:MAG: flagellar M-ring protein FliF [Candidatus Eremiobacteraeota bacterium]|nr:flagellar M-ring protein FliF [Candidatus Eremiobacteraeota bacterium]